MKRTILALLTIVSGLATIVAPSINATAADSTTRSYASVPYRNVHDYADTENGFSEGLFRIHGDGSTRRCSPAYCGYVTSEPTGLYFHQSTKGARLRVIRKRTYLVYYCASDNSLHWHHWSGKHPAPLSAVFTVNGQTEGCDFDALSLWAHKPHTH